MKNAALHVREFKKLLKKIRRENAAPFPTVEEPMDQLIRGILTDYASDSRAAAGLARLQEAIVDINELRVTPVAEIVEVIGPDFPLCRRAAEDIIKALNAIFNKLHHLDLGFLKKAARRTAESFLHSLDGVNEHARASVILRCLKGHAVPADIIMCEILRREGCVEPDATTEQIHKFLASQIKESQAASFYAQFKRYAAAHAPKKPIVTRSQAIRTSEPAPQPLPDKAPQPVEARPPKAARANSAAPPAKDARRHKADRPAASPARQSAKSNSSARTRKPAKPAASKLKRHR